MSSGSLPQARYHRASQVGSGSFGSVLTVYNDAGEEYALKLFAKEKDNDPIDVGALREISCLRLLRDQNRHDNIVELLDVQVSTILDEEGDDDDDFGVGAGMQGCIGMTLPLYRVGSLEEALTGNRLRGIPRQNKITLSHGLLSAVAFLHDNGILHRDIKCANILLEINDRDEYKPVLIDFSLAKPVDSTIFQGGTQDGKLSSRTFEAMRHTGGVGTVTYTAPEVFSQENPSYGKPMDLWSVGVILLEVWQDGLLEAQKNSHALKMIESKLASLPEKPFPALLRNLLQVDPTLRHTSRQALQSVAFTKLGLMEPPKRLIHLATSLPVDDTEDLVNQENRPNRSKTRPSKRQQLVERLCHELGGAQNPFTIPAALEYATQMDQLDDNVDDVNKSTALLDCVVLAFRFWERELLDLEELEEWSTGLFASWNQASYIDNEASIFLMLEFCLYPRMLRR